MLDGPGGVSPRPPRIENASHGIEKLLLTSQVEDFA
jgi:hypothetical protein